MNRIKSPIRSLRIALPSPRGYSRMPNLYADTPTNGMETVPLSERFPEADREQNSRRTLVGIGYLFFIVAISVGCGVALELLSAASGHSGGETPAEKLYLSAVSAYGARANLELYSNNERLAGTQGDADFAHAIKAKMINFGFPEDSITIKEYDVLLNTPVNIELSLLSSPPVTFDLSEPPIDERKTVTRSYPPFHFYSADGNVTANVVYVNYGRTEDFEMLRNHSINLSQTIVLIRSGKIGCAAKVHNAEIYGAIGALVYNDPGDDGDAKGPAYPDGPWRPETSVQSASVLMGQGDPSTPYEASSTIGQRISLLEVISSNVSGMPDIPSIPISAKVAKKIMQSMLGSSASDLSSHWVGGLGVPYRLGGAGPLVQLINTNKYENKRIMNVIAVVEGKVEPDRYVLLGSQRDSSTSGAIYPGSGTTVMLEVARGMGQLLQGGWRPRRTLVLTSWSAEEYGMIGSSEWVQEYATHLKSRAAVYLDINAAVLGPGTFECSASPSLKSVVYRASRLVYDPSNDGSDDPDARRLSESDSHTESPSIFSLWMDETKKINPDARYPKVYDPGYFSDIPAFTSHLGIPSINIRFRSNFSGISGSIYDTFDWMDRFGDPDFKYHRTLAQIWGVIALSFTESQFLPYNFEHYAYVLNNEARALESFAISRNVNVSFIRLKKACSLFEMASKSIGEKIMQIAKGDLNILDGSYRANPSGLREINDRLMLTERVFLAADGRPWYKHIVFAPAQRGDFAIVRLPGLRAAIAEQDMKRSVREMSMICLIIEEAAEFLTVTLV